MGNTSCDGEMVVRQNDEWGFAGEKLASAKKYWKIYFGDGIISD
jgi:hypothetical protein